MNDKNLGSDDMPKGCHNDMGILQTVQIKMYI